LILGEVGQVVTDRVGFIGNAAVLQVIEVLTKSFDHVVLVIDDQSPLTSDRLMLNPSVFEKVLQSSVLFN
jgi:hypothetical protein